MDSKELKPYFLQLLSPDISDTTLKNRRNLLASSFTVLATDYIGLSLNEVRVFGIDLNEGSNSRLLVVAISLILFWMLMYVLNGSRDALRIKAERSLFNAKIIEAKEGMQQLREARPGSIQTDQSDNAKLQGFVDKTHYWLDVREETRKETTWFRLLTYFVLVIEYILPLLMAVGAICFLYTELQNMNEWELILMFST